MVRVAVSSQGTEPDDGTDARFGRAACFVVYDTEKSEWSVLSNAVSRDMPQGAGLAATEILSRAGVDVVLTGAVGPKATSALSAAKITFLEKAISGSARQSIADYLTAQKIGEVLP